MTEQRFTDEDVKRLKGFIAIDDFYKSEGSHYMGPLVKALLARLEASEALLPWANCICGSGSPCHCGYWEKKETWRRVAGE